MGMRLMRFPLRRQLVLPGVIVALTVLVVGAGAVAAFESRTVGSSWELLSLISAALASIFVREDEEPVEAREEALEQQILDRLAGIELRLESLERGLADHDGTDPAEP